MGLMAAGQRWLRQMRYRPMVAPVWSTVFVAYVLGTYAAGPWWLGLPGRLLEAAAVCVSLWVGMVLASWWAWERYSTERNMDDAAYVVRHALHGITACVRQAPGDTMVYVYRRRLLRWGLLPVRVWR